MSELGFLERLKVWDAAGVGITLTPSQVHVVRMGVQETVDACKAELMQAREERRIARKWARVMLFAFALVWAPIVWDLVAWLGS